MHNSEEAGADFRLPSRIQRRRSRGWRQPSSALYVGRPTKWWESLQSRTKPKRRGSCDVVSQRPDRRSFTVDDVRRELNGSDLICWCKAGAPCHADVLLAVAN